MNSYSCPYCSYPITSDNVLFQYNSRKLPYRDARRFAFYNLCSSSWPLESDKFEGLYLLASDAEDGQVTRDENGFPLTILAKPCNGKTPSELERMELPGEPLDNFIAQYYNSDPYAAYKESATQTETSDTFSSFGAATAAQAKDQNAEIKPVDDSTTVNMATRACPNCHNELHQKFGQIPTVNVTLLGGPSAGKTAYLLSLTHQLSMQLAVRGLGTAQLLKASDLYFSYLNKGYQNMETTMPTVRQEKLFPFVFYYTNKWQKECFVKFSDIAGETTTEADSLLNHRGTMEASTLLMILDPNQLNQGLFNAKLNANTGSYNTSSSVDCYDTDIINFATASIGVNVALGAFRNVAHVIAVFSKMDMVLQAEREMFGAGRTDVDCAVRYDLGRQHTGALDEAVINRIGRDLDRIVNRVLGQSDFNLRRYLRSLFPADMKVDTLLLGVSTHTLVDAKNIVFENRCNANASKHRIIEPFLCILAQNGMIPINRAASRTPNAEAGKAGKKH